MKNSANIALAILFLVVLGCSCPNLKDLAGNKGNSTPTPTSSPVSTPIIPGSKGEYDVTIAKYDNIKKGMARSEVESILGGKGTEVSRNSGGGLKFSVDKWQGDNYAAIILTFKNDKVFEKRQVGLK